MAERVYEIDVQELVKQGRTPIVVDGWTTGSFVLIAPEGAQPGEQADNEQIGHFPSGYGEIIMLTEDQAGDLKKRISKINDTLHNTSF